MGGCSKFTRFVLIAINVLFFILGGVSLGIGIWVLVDNGSQLTKVTQIFDAISIFDVASLLKSAAIVFLVSGAVILVLSFCGCCGAWKKSRCLLIVYGIIVLIIAILEVAVIVTAAVFANKVQTELKNVLKDSLSKNYNSGALNTTADGTFRFADSDPITLAWDVVQIEIKCCGVDSWSDYNSTAAWTNRILYVAGSPPQTMKIPPSCCDFTNSTAAAFSLKSNTTAYVTLKDKFCPASLTSSYSSAGCYTTVENLIKNNSVAVLAISAAIVAIQVILVIFAFCLARLIQAEK